MKWIISNHKNALIDKDINNYLEELKNLKTDNIHLVICPKDEHLIYFSGTNYEIGSQDINIHLSNMKKNVIKYSIIGHSYSRKKYHETNEEINKKIKELLRNNIIPILCVGEEESNDVKETLKQELIEGLKDIQGKIIIAYEPVWAIGSGKIPSIDALKDIIEFIDKEATKILNNKPIILYGGSVNENTINELEKIKELDGYLIGNASIDIEKLRKVIEVVR